MTMYKEDLRVIRTRKLLSSTLLKMLETESIEKINVSDICDRAMVHRTTFYTHFEDKYQLLEYSIEEIRDTIIQKSAPTQGNSPNDAFHDIAYYTLHSLEKNKESFSAILKHNFNERIISLSMTAVERYIRIMLARYRHSNTFRAPLPVITNFFTGGLINLSFWWLRNYNTYTIDQLLEYMDIFFGKNVYMA